MSYSGQPAPQPASSRASNCLLAAVILFAVLLGLFILLSMAGFVLLPVLLEGMSRRGFGPQEHPAVGQTLPELDLEPLTGTDQPVTLEDVSGRVVLLNFWGTWCPPCRAELPHIADVYESFRDEPDFLLLAVSCGRGGPDDVDELRENTAGLLGSMRIDMPTYADPQFVSRDAFDRVGGFDGYPTTMLLDRQGVIRAVWVGFDPRIGRQLEELIPELLAEDPTEAGESEPESEDEPSPET